MLELTGVSPTTGLASGSAADRSGGLTSVTAKGLLSYDAEDADFFLNLLPPPLDRGLPRCVRFWKDGIEERDADKAFRIALLFGPSGCGKSSMVKAGLIPHLDDSVLPVYIEATPDDTETRLLNRLRSKLPELPEDASLEDTLQWIIDHPETTADRKVLIVLDQFEQWLHAHRAEQDTALVSGLRACDGANLQCLLMIRPEFMLAVWRFADQLGVDWQMGRNMALVDLFDPAHARKVLAGFGSSYERLPDDPGRMSEEQSEFLDQSVAALADRDGRIVAWPRFLSCKAALCDSLVRKSQDGRTKHPPEPRSGGMWSVQLSMSTSCRRFAAQTRFATWDLRPRVVHDIASRLIECFRTQSSVGAIQMAQCAVHAKHGAAPLGLLVPLYRSMSQGDASLALG